MEGGLLIFILLVIWVMVCAGLLAGSFRMEVVEKGNYSP